MSKRLVLGGNRTLVSCGFLTIVVISGANSVLTPDSKGLE